MSKVVIFNRKGKQSRGICYQSSAARGVLRRPGRKWGRSGPEKGTKGTKRGGKGAKKGRQRNGAKRMENKGRADGKQRRENRKQRPSRRETETGRAGMVEGRTVGRAGNGAENKAERAEKRDGTGRKLRKRKSEEVRKERVAGRARAKEKRRQSGSKKRVLRGEKRKKLKAGKGPGAGRKQRLDGRAAAAVGSPSEIPLFRPVETKGEGSVKNSSPWSKRALRGYFCTISSSSSNQPAPANLSTMKST